MSVAATEVQFIHSLKRLVPVPDTTVESSCLIRLNKTHVQTNPFRSLLLILEISIAHNANDRTKLIIAPYSICVNGLIEKDSLTLDELLNRNHIYGSSIATIHFKSAFDRSGKI